MKVIWNLSALTEVIFIALFLVSVPIVVRSGANLHIFSIEHFGQIVNFQKERMQGHSIVPIHFMYMNIFRL